MQLPRPPIFVRRLLVVSTAGLMLTSLVSFALAAPTDSAIGNNPVAFAGTVPPTQTLSPSSPTRTPTAKPGTKATATSTTPMGFAQQPSMAGDAGSSMGADAPSNPNVTVTMTATSPTMTPTATRVLPTATVPPFIIPTVAPASASTTACTPLMPGNDFAFNGFQAQWQAGEALTANFWGPAGTAGLPEPYAETGGQRTVQYFDKGRMELSPLNTVTNGLLATEMITGQVQVGDSTFQAKAPPAIPIAGDPDNAGPTYAGLGTTGVSLLAPTAMATGQGVATQVAADGTVSMGAAGSDPATVLSSYDATTQHNVPQAFAQYRDKVSLAAVGLAKSEPFFATVKVGGVQKQVMMQVFERRVLTYTADNDPPFRVEMGNIGQHYYRWRYCS